MSSLSASEASGSREGKTTHDEIADAVVTTIITILAHNEERRIAACLDSLPLGTTGIDVHVVVNGSTDATADIAERVAAGRATVHRYVLGGKARSWNRFVLDEGPPGDVHVFVDGDAVVAPGSIDELVATLHANPAANAASGMPLNGRGAARYRESLSVERGLFGDLYALRGTFVARMRAASIRLPDDLIGDDGLVAALVKTDLADESDWRDARIVPCATAGWWCEPTRVTDPATWRVQYRRMIAYSTRHFQNRIISDIMRRQGPAALPQRLATLYPAWLDRFAPRRDPMLWWFDRQALRRMRVAVR